MSETSYQEFLKSKQYKIGNRGLEICREDIHPKLFDWQKDIVQWATRKGRCAVFLDTGLGKTFIQLEWARLMGQNTLIIAPLSVARQTVREAKKIDLDIQYVRSQSECDTLVGANIWITNYEMADEFDYSKFGAIVLDESSILKSIGGKTRIKLTELCKDVPYKLCCTATPAPNDNIELGNHTEFLGICTNNEMLATFFINANKEHTLTIEGQTYRKKGSNKNGTEWRLKHHAESHFFRWLSSWAITMTKPSDLGYDDDGFVLPELNINPIFISSEYKPENQLFFTHLSGISDRANVRKTTSDDKVDQLKEIVSSLNLCYNLSYEQKTIHERMVKQEQGTRQAIQGRNKRKEELPQERIIRKGRIQENSTKETSKDLGKGTPREASYTTIETLQDRPSTIFSVNEKTKQPMCNMRDSVRQSEGIPVCRPLPQDGKDKRSTVPELQSRIRENAGFTDPIAESSRISREQCIIWCGLDIEQRLAEDLCESLGISYSSVYGSLSIDDKLQRIDDWVDNKTIVMISKPKVLGFGMNFQNAHNMVFFGINDSWETYYQAIRREWRYGQKEQVNVYIIMHDVEAEVYQNIMRKDAMARRLKTKLIEQIKDYEKGELGLDSEVHLDYTENTKQGDNWKAMLGDSCERLKEIPENSIDLSVYSPPFADLFTYSASERDLGNSKDWDEFFSHYKFIIREVLRTTKPGRNTCVHTSDIPAMQIRDGYIGMRDFPGAVIKAYTDEGWIFYGRALVQKNPQAQAIRVRAKGLAFQQLRKDSADSRPALVDHVLIFKKPGENEVPVTPVENGEMDNETWIEWANGIWLGIHETDTLQFTNARGSEDEKHICPLQLGTIERCIKLYSNPNEMVLTPFGGIGSEAYMAVKLGRKATLVELKPEYFDVACKNLVKAESEKMAVRLI